MTHHGFSSEKWGMDPPSRRRRACWLGLAASALVPVVARASKAVRVHRFALSPLPYSENALDPVISAYTMMLHHGRLHRQYVADLNQLWPQTQALGLPGDVTLESVIARTATEPEYAVLYTAAAQHWNHDFFWKSLRPRGSTPPLALRPHIEESFGSLHGLKASLLAVANAQVGSAWAWLVWEQHRLAVTCTPNADPPFIRGQHALLGLDVWEHAYAHDYQERRAEYMAAVVDRLWNWDFALNNLESTGRA